MPRLRLELLGGFRATSESGDLLDFSTRKAEALLAFLAIQPGMVHTRERLASLLWGFSAGEQARQSLRQTLFGLRKSLGDFSEILIAVEDKLSLDPQGVEIDIVEFEQTCREGSRTSLERAAVLYKGDLLTGLDLDEAPFDDSIASERERLRQMAIGALNRLYDLLADEGRSPDALRIALRSLALDPLQEAVHRSLMRLYLRSGRSEAALKQYQNLVDLLRRELRTEPDSETRELQQAIERQRRGPLTPDDALHPPMPVRKGIAVLLIEDNALHRNLIKAMLVEPQFSLTTVDDGAQALIEIGKGPYDLILLDIHLPTIDGLTLLRAMQQNKIDTPTILLTASAGEVAEVKGLELGASDFMRKPVNREVLLTRIDKALREHKLRQSVKGNQG